VAHPNEDLMKKGYEAFGSGDLDAVRELFADDIVWHVPGRSPLAGDYKGKEEVLGFLAKTMEMTGGTFKLDVHDVMAGDEHGVALTTATAEREGKRLSNRAVQVVHIRGGKLTESWFHPEDQYAVDEFWS